MAIVASSHRPSTPAVSAAGGPLRRLGFAALGTMCEIQYACDDAGVAAAFEKRALEWVLAFEAKYSRFRADSLVSRINAAAGRAWVEIDPEMAQMLTLCDTLVFLTQGIIDPTILPLMEVWDYKRPRTALPADEDIARARSLVGWSKVQREAGRIYLPEPGMALDFGGFGKEYAVDLVAQIAADMGIANVLVDFGHDLRTDGQPPGRPGWHIGLENPRKPEVHDGSIAVVGSRGIASSGDYLRSFTVGGRRYGHIVDPRTGWPVANGALQATVIASTCLHAGVLSTTAFVLGVPKGIEFIQSFPGAEGLIVTERARAQTRGFFNYVAS